MSETDGDPFVANAAEAARLVREVQDLGFEAARTIVERFAGLFTQFAAGGAGGVGAAGAPRQGGDGWPAFGLWGTERSRQVLQTDMQRAADSYLAIMGQLNEAGLRFLDAARWSHGPGASEQGDLRLPDVAPGGRVSARLWLHNTTDSPAADLRPWCPGLTSPGGTALATGAVTCTPERITRLDPGTSVELLITVAVGEDEPPGAYHGQLLVDGLPDLAFPLRLQVQPTAKVP